MSTDQVSFLDRPAARLLALLVIFLCGGLIALVHRDDLPSIGGLPSGDRVEAADTDPAAPCINERFAEIEGMVEEGIVDDAKAALFKERAEAMCRATTGDGGQAPPAAFGVTPGFRAQSDQMGLFRLFGPSEPTEYQARVSLMLTQCW